MNVNYFCN